MACCKKKKKKKHLKFEISLFLSNISFLTTGGFSVRHFLGFTDFP